MPEDLLMRHPDARMQVLAAMGAMEFWSGNLTSAASAFRAGAAVAATSAGESDRADCVGNLALVEAIGGHLNRAVDAAADCAAQAEHDSDQQAGLMSPAAEVALACVHTERNELSLAADRLRRADAALRARPDKLTRAVACLVAGRRSLAQGRPAAALQMTQRARRNWSAPAWLEQRLTLLESRAHAAASDRRSAADAATKADAGSVFGAAVALAHARLADGDARAARQAQSAVPAGADTGDVRVERWLIDAQLSYGIGDRGRGRRSLEQALRLAESEQHRLPFVMQRGWLMPVLRQDRGLADAYRRLLQPDMASPAVRAADRAAAEVAAPLIVERLSARENEVLRYMSEMLSTAEIAARMYISVNTVKTHVKSIYRKLAASQRGEAVRRARQLGLLPAVTADPAVPGN